MILVGPISLFCIQTLQAKISLEPSLPQIKSLQLLKPHLIGEILQSLNHLCDCLCSLCQSILYCRIQYWIQYSRYLFRSSAQYRGWIPSLRSLESAGRTPKNILQSKLMLASLVENKYYCHLTNLVTLGFMGHLLLLFSYQM